MYGIMVNVGPPGAPHWKWLHCPSMDRFESETREIAEQQIAAWYPPHKAGLFKVERIDEGV